MKNTKSLLCMILYCAFCITMFNTPTSAQTFEILNVETKNYPQIEAYYLVKDKNGAVNPSLSLNEFEVTLNGKNISSDATANLQKDCKVEDYATPFACALLLDCSRSMEDEVEYGVRRFDWLKDGVLAFVDSLRMNEKSQMKVVPFSTDERTSSPWYNNKTQVREWIDKNLKDPNGATDFNDAFLQSSNPDKMGAVKYLQQVDPELPKFIVMITDGIFEGPDHFKYDEIIDSCKAHDITFYCISVQTTVDSGINYLAFDTKGESYVANNKNDISYFLDKILHKIEITNVCKFIYNNPYICEGDSKQQKLEVLCKYYSITDTYDYMLGDEAVATAEVSDNKLFFGSISQGKNSNKFQITANKTSFKITDYAISGDDDKTRFSISPAPPFTVSASTPTEVTVTYLKDPADASAKYELTFVSEPCDIPVVELIAPCYGKTMLTVDMGDAPVGAATSFNQNCVLENTTPEPITGNLIIEGTDAADFTITAGGGAFTLYPTECLNISLEVNPSTAGTKTAELNYQITNADYCGNAKTTVTANAVATDFPINAVNIALTRVDASRTVTHTIKNNRTSEANITSMTLENNSDIFTLVTPFTGKLAAGASTDIEIKFTPKAEGTQECDLVLEVEDLDNSVSTKVTGIGGLPAISTQGASFGSLKAGLSSSPIGIIIENTSSYMKMHIKEIKFATATNDFEFATGTKLTDITIDESSSINIPVIFTPTKGGLITADIEVINDAVKGEEPVTYKTTIVKVEGEGLALEVNPGSLNYGEILSCDTKELSVTIPNNSSSEMTVKVTITGNNPSDFDVEKTDYTIPANSSDALKVYFTPGSDGTFDAEINIETNSGFAIVTLGGTAISAVVSTDFKIGNKDLEIVKVPILSGLNSLNFEIETGLPANLETLPSTVIYTLNLDNSNTMRYTPGSFVTASGWSLVEENTSMEDNGVIKITVEPQAGAVKSARHSLAFKGYVGDTDSLNIKLDAEYPGMSCLDSEGDLLPVQLISCFVEGNLINISEFQMGDLLVKGNPANETSTIDYSVAYETYVEVYIYDSMGKKVATLRDGITSEGDYSDKVPYELLESGVYNITMRAGLYQTTTRLAVVK